MKPSEIAFGILRIPVDFLMTVLAFFLAYQIRLHNLIPVPGSIFQLPTETGGPLAEVFPPLDEYVRFSAIAAVFVILIAAANRMYSLKSTSKFSRELRQIFWVATTWLMGMIAYFFLTRTFPFSRLALIYTWLLAMILIASGRLVIRTIQFFLLKAGIGKKKILFIGDNAITHRLMKALSKDHSYKIVGYLDNRPQAEKTVRYLGTLEELGPTVKKHQIEEIIQTKTDLEHQQAADILAFCREHHLNFSFVPDLLEMQQANIETETWGDIPVIKLKPTPLDGWGKVTKRAFDIVGSMLGLIILSPVFLLTAAAIKLDSKGTVFFKYLDDGSRVKRVGEHGKSFNFYKFRTMYPNTHNLRYTKLAEKNIRKDSPLVKIKNDPRVTRVGRFLRKTSIDELPQLINVLKGEMSLVGPRPHLPEEVAKYEKHHKFVLAIKPGITGLAQTSGRSDLNFEEEVRLDTYYIEHWSPWLDLVILFKTFGVIFKAYNE